ncbi:hypothetical protein [Hyphomonas johnsonii]|jgi:cell division protein FtsL|uniref:Uncharacterized protein n=1 Tax=Hyphomonas johnsonii MHS-2 TaxID=1280950 RepID=A0A059FRU4_9PROT|nr:hypothetical protein [Hyphomonas johnsonii]KCZ93337.1 hypothetical protein HJO_05760 [Hyphomonas johnsonii MHS-2]
MEIVKSEGLSHGSMPTVFEERTLFSPPQPPVIDAQYSQKRGGSVLPAIIFLFMLVPCAGLGYMVYQSSGQVEEMRQQIEGMKTDDTAGEIAGLNAQIAALTTERDALKVEVTTVTDSQSMFDKDIGRLVSESAALTTEINDLLAGQRKGGPAIPVSLRTIPDTWDDQAIEILQKHVDGLKAHKVKVIGNRPLPPKPTTGTISGTPRP